MPLPTIATLIENQSTNRPVKFGSATPDRLSSGLRGCKNGLVVPRCPVKLGGGVALELRMIRTKTHKLTVDLNSGAGELFDLEADPHELANLLDRAEVAAVQAQLQVLIGQRPDDWLSDQVPVGTA